MNFNLCTNTRLQLLVILSMNLISDIYSVIFVDICELECRNAMSLNCSALNSTLRGRRCCTDGEKFDVASYIGIDLAECQLKNITGLFHGMENLQVLLIQNNELHSIDVEDFTGVLHLKELKLPSIQECPGGKEQWEDISTTGNVTTCVEEKSTCSVFNVTCPNSNSYCHDIAPRLTECLCLPGYHGYKCLKKGKFTTSTYLIGLCASIVVMAGLLWFSQRRKTIKKAD